MSKKENFKNFVSKNPDFIKTVKEGKVSWQKMYELYDLYGEDDKIWDDYRSSGIIESLNSFNIKGLLNSLKGINLETFQNNISSLQKAVGFLEDLTRENKKKTTKKKNQNSALDPMERFYSD